jgi:hypothetical protein
MTRWWLSWPRSAKPVPTPKELLRDPLWRLKNLYSCREEGTGRAIPLILRPEQELLVHHLIERPSVPIYVIKSRRLGISTLVDTFQADQSIFSSGFRGLIVDQKQADATKKMVEIVRFAVDNVAPAILAGLVIDKRNDSELRLRHKDEPESADSVIYATTGGRGGDCSMLHVSEWGPIAATDPVRSREIRTGTFPSARLGRRVVETTWYGGKSGDLWDLVKPILDGNPNAEGVVYFFPWHADPQAIKLEGQLNDEIEDYFRELGAKLGKSFSTPQKFWYAAKQVEQGMWVRREYPSILDEALSVPMAGTIYGEQIDELRAKKRISDFPADESVQAFTFWDIGLSDFGCVWLVQLVGRDILLLDYYSNEGVPAATYAAQIVTWEQKHKIKVGMNYLPHDANTRERSSGTTYAEALRTAGLKHMRVVPRTSDVWLGINELRTLLPRCYIHSVNCAATGLVAGRTIPSGLDCLEYYHKKVESVSGAIYEHPVHDHYSNGADALRTFSEAHRLGMIEGTSYTATQTERAQVKVLRGAGPESYSVKGANPYVRQLARR